MFIGKRLTFNHPDDFYKLPAEFAGKWIEYEAATIDGKNKKAISSKAESNFKSKIRKPKI